MMTLEETLKALADKLERSGTSEQKKKFLDILYELDELEKQERQREREIYHLGELDERKRQREQRRKRAKRYMRRNEIKVIDGGKLRG